MIRKAAIAGLLGSLLLVSGCATMSGEECLTSDWSAIGYEDGAQGFASDRLAQRRKACAKHGVTPNFDDYQAGRSEGLQEFCQPQRGFNLGERGGRYNGVCPAQLELDFLDAFRTGSQLHSLRANVSSANNQIRARERELEDLDETVRSKEATLIANDTTVQDRVLILADLKDLSERKGQIEAEILDLIEDRTVYEQQLASFEALLADSGY